MEIQKSPRICSSPAASAARSGSGTSTRRIGSIRGKHTMAACVASAGVPPRHYISITASSSTRAPRPFSQRPRWTVLFSHALSLETAKLWCIHDDHPSLVHTLSGHINRVSAVAFHPSGPSFSRISLQAASLAPSVSTLLFVSGTWKRGTSCSSRTVTHVTSWAYHFSATGASRRHAINRACAACGTFDRGAARWFCR